MTTATREAHPMHEARLGRTDPPSAAGILDGLVLLAGLYLIIAPFIHDQGVTKLAINNLVIGVALALLAVGYARNFASLSTIAWTIPVLGIWEIVAPWVIYHAPVEAMRAGVEPVPLSTSVWIGNVIAGGVVLVAGAGSAGFGWKAARPRHLDRQPDTGQRTPPPAQ
jgi:hypothetical protein